MLSNPFGNLPPNQLVVKGQTDPATESIELARGERMHVYGRTQGSLPSLLTGTGRYSFDMLTAGFVVIEKAQFPASPSDMGRTGLSSNERNQRLVIGALVKQLGGAVVIPSFELQSMNGTLNSWQQEDMLFLRLEGQ